MADDCKYGLSTVYMCVLSGYRSAVSVVVFRRKSITGGRTKCDERVYSYGLNRKKIRDDLAE